MLTHCCSGAARITKSSNFAPSCVRVAGSVTMAEREPHYFSEPTDLDALNRNTLRRGIGPYELRRSEERETSHDGLAPLFLSGDQDEPFPDEYIIPVRKRRVSVSTR